MIFFFFLNSPLKPLLLTPKHKELFSFAFKFNLTVLAPDFYIYQLADYLNILHEICYAVGLWGHTLQQGGIVKEKICDET